MILKNLIIIFSIFFSTLVLSQETGPTPQLQLSERVTQAFDDYLEDAVEDEDAQIRIRTRVALYHEAEEDEKLALIENLKARLSEDIESLQNASEETNSSPYRDNRQTLKQVVRNIVINQAILMGSLTSNTILRRAHQKSVDLLRGTHSLRDLFSSLTTAGLGLLSVGTILYHGHMNLPVWMISFLAFISQLTFAIDSVRNYSPNYSLEVEFSKARDVFDVIFALPVIPPAYILSKLLGTILYMTSFPRNIIREYRLNISVSDFRRTIQSFTQLAFQERLFHRLRNPIEFIRQIRRSRLARDNFVALVEKCRD